MLFLLAAILSAAAALFTAATLGVKGKPAYLLAIYLLAAGSIVLCFELLGLARVLNNRALFFGLQALITLLSFFMWWHRGKPHLLGPFAPDLRRLDFSRLGPSLRRHPALWLLALAVDLAYAVNAYLILVVPPNNNDSLYLHMARVARWLQNGSFYPYPTTFTLQLYYPFNAQALIYWTVLFWGSDQLAGFVQFSAAIVTMLGVYAFSRLLGSTRPQGIFAALLWASLPQVLFQSTTTQNDLVPAAMLVAGIYFLVTALRSSAPRASLFLSAVGISLALGAKQTAFFILPGLLLSVIILGWRGRPVSIRLLLRWAPTAAVTFFLLGSAIYLQNFIVYQNLMGDPQTIYNYIQIPKRVASINPAITDDTAESSASLHGLWINANRLAYQLVDTTGLPPLIEGYLFRGKAHLARSLYARLNLPLESQIAANPNSAVVFDFFRRPPLQEDETWFGIFAPFLILPAALFQLLRSIRRADPLPGSLWLLSLSFVLIEMLLRPGWDVYLGRNFIIAAVLLAPFAAFVYRPHWFWRAAVWLVVLLTVYSLATLTLNNTAKPLVGQKAIWNLSRADKLTLQNYQLKEPARLVAEHVPEDAVLALPPSLWEYPFYDAHLRRVLVSPAGNDLFNDPSWMRRQTIQYLLVTNSNPPPSIALPLKGVAAAQNWSLYRIFP